MLVPAAKAEGDGACDIQMGPPHLKGKSGNPGHQSSLMHSP